MVFLKKYKNKKALQTFGQQGFFVKF